MGRRSRGTGSIRSPYAGRQAESNNLGATKKKSVLGCILVPLRSRIYRTRSRMFQLLELRELRKSQAITKDVPPLMDIDPVSVEVGSTDTRSDADPSWAQAPELVEEMRSYAPTLTIPQLFALVFANNPKLVGMANRKPDFHSAATRKTNSDIEPTDDPKAAYEKLQTMAEEMALREDITMEKAFAKLYEKDSPLARCATRHVALEPAARW